MENLTQNIQQVNLNAANREKEAERACKKLLQKYQNYEQIFEEDLLEQDAYADVCNLPKIDRWESEMGFKARGREIMDRRLAFRFAILPSHYQLAYAFSSGMISGLMREDRDWLYRSIWAFQGDEGQRKLFNISCR